MNKTQLQLFTEQYTLFHAIEWLGKLPEAMKRGKSLDRRELMEDGRRTVLGKGLDTLNIWPFNTGVIPTEVTDEAIFDCYEFLISKGNEDVTEFARLMVLGIQCSGVERTLSAMLADRTILQMSKESMFGQHRPIREDNEEVMTDISRRIEGTRVELEQVKSHMDKLLQKHNPDGIKTQINEYLKTQAVQENQYETNNPNRSVSK